MAKILLLESDRQLARCTADFLRGAGHTVEIYFDPQNAILAADTNKPDIVILDLCLAGRSGIEFLYELRSYPEWQAIPVITTGRLDGDERAAFAEALGQLNVASYLPRQAAGLQELLAAAEKQLQVYATV